MLLQSWSDKADAFFQLAKALMEQPTRKCTERAAVALQQAAHNAALPHDAAALDVAHAAVECGRAAFQEATSWSSSENGDDLPALLCNWGTALQSGAEVEVARGDATQAIELLQDAVSRLQASLQFNRGDVAVRILHLSIVVCPAAQASLPSAQLSLWYSTLQAIAELSSSVPRAHAWAISCWYVHLVWLRHADTTSTWDTWPRV